MSDSASNPHLNARQRLRDLIDALEARYSLMPEDAISLALTATMQANLKRWEPPNLEEMS